MIGVFMDWYKILLAITLLGMIVLIFPRMLDSVRNSPKGTAEDWKMFLLPLVGVVLFIALLTQVV